MRTEPSENVYGRLKPFTVRSVYVPATEPLGDVASLHAARAIAAKKRAIRRIEDFLMRLSADLFASVQLVRNRTASSASCRAAIRYTGVPLVSRGGPPRHRRRLTM